MSAVPTRRASLICWSACAFALFACSGRGAKHPHADPEPTAPGLRLPDDVVPLAYDVKLELDPAGEAFRGEVKIRVRVTRTTDHVWLHAYKLVIGEASYDGGPLMRTDVAGDQMVAFRFGRKVQPGELTLRFGFTGMANGEQEGLFRQRDGEWFVFSQGEAIFTRRITPCFDEPRFKTPWRVTLVVPKQDIALSNMPEAKTTVLGALKEVVFEDTPPMPSYLLAVAVGPFELVDAGKVGRNRIPVRVAVPPGKAGKAGVVAQRLPAIVDALEAYLDQPLPLKKLDAVVVPEFFGAMENPGLITFDKPILIGDVKSPAFVNYFVSIAAHELAHQWFGNLVTPAWWDHLWISEGVASWLGDKVVRELHAYDDPTLRFALARREAIDADRKSDVHPLWRRVTTTADADEGFDSISYAKGQVVLSTIEAFAGEEGFRTALRELLRVRRGTSITTDEALATLGTSLGGPLVGALHRYLAKTGTPLAELELECHGTPSVHAKVSGGAVPFCVAYPSGATTARSCALVGDSTSLSVGATCPAWVRANPDGGYVHTRWKTNGPRGPAPKLSDLDPLGRLVAGDDLAASIDRGELAAGDALGQLRALIDLRDSYADLGAVAIVKAIDPLVGDTDRAAWNRWLAARFADKLAIEKLVAERRGTAGAAGEVRRALVDMFPASAFPTASTHQAFLFLDRNLAEWSTDMPASLVRLAAVEGGSKLFERIVARAQLLHDDDVRDTWLESLGELGPAQLPLAIELATGASIPVAHAWLALKRYLERPDTRTAAWHAVKAALPKILRRMTAVEAAAVIDGTSHLCDPADRADVEATFAGRVNTITKGREHLAAALSAIDICVARRAKLGDVTAAIAGLH